MYWAKNFRQLSFVRNAKCVFDPFTAHNSVTFYHPGTKFMQIIVSNQQIYKELVSVNHSLTFFIKFNHWDWQSDA